MNSETSDGNPQEPRQTPSDVQPPVSQANPLSAENQQVAQPSDQAVPNQKAPTDQLPVDERPAETPGSRGPENPDPAFPESVAVDPPTTHAQPTPSAAADSEGAAEQASAGEQPRKKIQIGSRREPTEKTPASTRPKVAGAEKPIKIEGAVVPAPPPPEPVPTPSVRDPMTPDLEAQLAAAMGDESLDAILSGSIDQQVVPTLEPDTRCKTAVARIHGDNVFFRLGGRHEGVASMRQFPEPPELGTELEVIVKSYSAEDGLYEVVVPGASTHVEDWSDLVEGTVVETRITGANTGGLECKVGSIRGFIPSSQIAMFRVEDYAEFIDQKLLCIVTEVNPQRKNLVLSRRAVLEREREEARKQLLENLEIGQVVEGVVQKIREFGAFVDVGGIDGLVHISQMSWDRVNHPSEVLTEGQKVRVKIEKIDPQTGKIGLSYRDLLEHPWTNIEDDFTVEGVVKGTVTRIARFGAFVKIGPGVEGLVHISELSHGRVPNVGSVVSEGQEVEVKIVSIDPEAQRIALSMKAVLPEPEVDQAAGDAATSNEAEQPAPEPAVPRRNEPLKGGTDRPSGGDQFGLKW